jgi:hypothetical protein
MMILLLILALGTATADTGSPADVVGIVTLEDVSTEQPTADPLIKHGVERYWYDPAIDLAVRVVPPVVGDAHRLEAVFGTLLLMLAGMLYEARQRSHRLARRAGLPRLAAWLEPPVRAVGASEETPGQLLLIERRLQRSIQKSTDVSQRRINMLETQNTALLGTNATLLTEIQSYRLAALTAAGHPLPEDR